MMPRCLSLAFGVVLLAACRGEFDRVPAIETSPSEQRPLPVTPSQPSSGETASDDEAVTNLVREFGESLQHVSLLAPDGEPERSIREQYAPFVSPQLLESWIANPTAAPGRTVSSPWPDRIEITTIVRESPDRYVIDGELVEITSGEGAPDHRIPVRLVVDRAGGSWRIIDYRPVTPSRITRHSIKPSERQL